MTGRSGLGPRGSGLAALAASDQLTAAFAKKPFALGKQTLARVLNGAEFKTLGPIGSPVLVSGEGSRRCGAGQGHCPMELARPMR